MVVISISTEDFGTCMLQRISDLENTSNIKLSLFEEIVRQIKQKHQSIGSIIAHSQLETFRKILKIGYNSKTRSLFRIYQIIYKGKVSFKIKEAFPLKTRV